MWPFSSGGPWSWLADHSCYLQELGCGRRQSPGRPAAQSPLLQSTSWDRYSCPSPRFSRSLIYSGACLAVLLELGNIGQGNAGAQIRHFLPALQQTLGCLPVPLQGYANAFTLLYQQPKYHCCCKATSVRSAHSQKNGSKSAAQQNKEDTTRGCLKGAFVRSI